MNLELYEEKVSRDNKSKTSREIQVFCAYFKTLDMKMGELVLNHFSRVMPNASKMCIYGKKNLEDVTTAEKNTLFYDNKIQLYCLFY